jgi:hypothetical protein
MRITFEQQPFTWTIDVDNPTGIRCRDVFKAIYNSFNQQLTLGELWRVPNREACEEAFRVRNIVLRSPQIERSLGWKRVDVLLHHTIFHGLSMNPEGDWVLNLGAPLPVPSLFFSQSLSFSRRNSSSTEEETAESPDEDTALDPPLPARFLALSPTRSRSDSYSTESESAESSATHASLSITIPVMLPRQHIVQSRPIRRPLGPRARRTPGPIL